MLLFVDVCAASLPSHTARCDQKTPIALPHTAKVSVAALKRLLADVARLKFILFNFMFSSCVLKLRCSAISTPFQAVSRLRFALIFAVLLLSFRLNAFVGVGSS